MAHATPPRSAYRMMMSLTFCRRYLIVEDTSRLPAGAFSRMTSRQHYVRSNPSAAQKLPAHVRFTRHHGINVPSLAMTLFQAATEPTGCPARQYRMKRYNHHRGSAARREDYSPLNAPASRAVTLTSAATRAHRCFPDTGYVLLTSSLTPKIIVMQRNRHLKRFIGRRSQ